MVRVLAHPRPVLLQLCRVDDRACNTVGCVRQECRFLDPIPASKPVIWGQNPLPSPPPSQAEASKHLIGNLECFFLFSEQEGTGELKAGVSWKGADWRSHLERGGGCLRYCSSNRWSAFVFKHICAGLYYWNRLSDRHKGLVIWSTVWRNVLLSSLIMQIVTGVILPVLRISASAP